MNKRILFLGLLPLIVLILAGSSPSAAGLARQDGLPPIPLPVWRSEVAAPGLALTGFGVPGMALDPQGKPHLVYGRNQLLHAWLDGATWRVEVVDATAGSISGPVITVDDAGVITLVACSVQCGPPASQLTVYRRAPGGAWQKAPVAAPGLTAAPSLSLALDSAGRPHVAAAAGGLVYAHATPAGWVSERVPLDVSAGGPIALALDSHDRPAVLYEGGVGQYSQEILWLARGGAAGWTHEQIALGRMLAGKSLALDAGDKVQAIFSDHYESPTLTYLRQTAAGWQSEVLTEALQQGGRSPSLALDEVGRPHIVYVSNWGGLIYAVLGDTGWQQSVVPIDGAHPGGSNTLLLDGSGLAHVASLNDGDSLHYATNRSGPWTAQLVAVHDPVGQRNALALDADDTPYLLYYSPATEQLRLAVRGSDEWTSDLVANVAAAGLELALAIGPDGAPQVAFTDSAADRLVVGKRIAGQWALETIGPAGHDLALAVGHDNRPQLVQIEDDRVVYRTKVAGQWTAEPISDAEVGIDVAFLALDSADRPYVAYPRELAVRQGAGQWESEVLPISDLMGMTVGPDGAPYLLAMRVEEMRGPPPPIRAFIIEFWERVDGEWRRTELSNDSMPPDEMTGRLVVDADGRVSLIFKDGANCNQRDSEGQWSSCRVFTLSGDVGLGVGHDHLPRLSGHTAGDLVFLRREIVWLDNHILLPVVPDL